MVSHFEVPIIMGDTRAASVSAHWANVAAMLNNAQTNR